MPRPRQQAGHLTDYACERPQESASPRQDAEREQRRDKQGNELDLEPEQWFEARDRPERREDLDVATTHSAATKQEVWNDRVEASCSEAARGVFRPDCDAVRERGNQERRESQPVGNFAASPVTDRADCRYADC
jgi:hypothetical protein